MAPRRNNPVQVLPSLQPERAHAALKKQLESLQLLRGKHYHEAKHEEQEWTQLTQSIVERSFGNPSSNLNNFHQARWAGDHAIVPYGDSAPYGMDQRNFEARLNAFEAFLKSCLSELTLIMPEKEIQGQYGPGQDYEFYRDVKTVLQSALSQVMIVDPYLGTDIFDVYADGINKSIQLRILTSNPPANVLAVARKYASGGNIELRTTPSIHDRLIFIDDRVWFIGQSIKDAAKKKPTYIVEQSGIQVRPVYEDIWNVAEIVVRSYIDDPTVLPSN